MVHSEVWDVWYIRNADSEALGPLDGDLVVRGVHAQRIPSSSMVCRVGDAAWTPIFEAPRFAPTPASQGLAPRPERSDGVWTLIGWAVVGAAILAVACGFLVLLTALLSGARF